MQSFVWTEKTVGSHSSGMEMEYPWIFSHLFSDLKYMCEGKGREGWRDQSVSYMNNFWVQIIIGKQY